MLDNVLKTKIFELSTSMSTYYVDVLMLLNLHFVISHTTGYWFYCTNSCRITGNMSIIRVYQIWKCSVSVPYIENLPFL